MEAGTDFGTVTRDTLRGASREFTRIAKGVGDAKSANG